MNPRYEGMERTLDVLSDVLDERVRQVSRYGSNEDLENGTGPEVTWIRVGANVDLPEATEIEQWFRWDYEKYEHDHGAPTWMHLVREEVAEAFQESNPERLEEELIQVAALCVSWVEVLQSKKEGLQRAEETCERCGLNVSGVGANREEALSRFKNNMRLHRGGWRCARRMFAQKREDEHGAH